MIDPAVRTQEIKNQLDNLASMLHRLATEPGLIFVDPHGTRAEVLACASSLNKIASEIDTAFPVGGAAR
jgi:hypothetical protein